jgi:putative oxidoreductase
MLTSQLVDQCAKLHTRFSHASSLLCSPFLLLVRLYWGWQFTQTGWGKLQHLQRVTQFFSSLNIPLPGLSAAFVSWLELIGGGLLILGLVSRLTALLLAIDMLVAYITADSAALHAILSDPGKFYNADPYTFLFASLLILFFGPGRFAIDFLLERRFSAKKAG